MKEIENPERLIHDPKLGKWLRPAADRMLEPERLSRCAQLIQQRLEETSQAKGSSWFDRIFWSRRMMRAVVPALLLISISVGATYLIRVFREPEKVKPPEAKAVLVKIKHKPRPLPRLTDLPEPPKPDKPSKLVRRRPKTLKVAQVQTEAAETVESHTSPQSQLLEQLRLFKKAKSAADSADVAGALSALDELKRQFPKGPLGPEAGLLRARILYQAGHFRQAAQCIAALIDDPSLAGKKAHLFRLLGDCHVHLKECEAAREAFRRALGLGLSGTEADEARRGIKKCTRQ